MAREVTHESTGPLRIDGAEIDERGGSVLLCRCGLSAEYPFCDGAHEATRDEAARTLSRYDGDTERREVVEVAVDGDEDGDREVVSVLADDVDDTEETDDMEETDAAGGTEPERTGENG